MRDSVRLSFSGRMETAHLDLPEPREEVLVRNLQEQAEAIRHEIAERIAESTGVPPTVSIDFSQGSVEWFGFVEWVQSAWPSIEALSTVGGAIGLIQLVKSAVDGVLRRWFRRLFGRTPFGPYPATQVVIVAVPQTFGARHTLWSPQTMFGVAAIIASVAALVAASALLLGILGR